MKCQQRKLLFEWLQFLIVDLVIGMWLLVNGSRKLIVIGFDAILASQWKNNGAEAKVMPKNTIRSVDSSTHEQAASDVTGWNISVAAAADDDNDNNNDYDYDYDEPINILSSTKMAKHQIFNGHCARISRCIEYRLLESELTSHPMHNNQIMMLPMTQIASASHQNTCPFSNPNCKSCQTKLFTNVDSLKQMPKPMDSVTEMHTYSPHNV